MAFQIPPRAGTIPGQATVKSPNTLNRMYDIISSGINTYVTGGYFTAADACENRMFITGHNPSNILGAAFGEQFPYCGCTHGCWVQVPGNNWSTVSMGYHYVATTKSDGTAWTWGQGSFGNWQWYAAGQLGYGGAASQSSPIQLPGNDWSRLNASCVATHAIKCDGTLWAFGSNQWGNLGIGTRATCNQYYSPVQVPGTTWKQVHSNCVHGAGVKCDGTLWAWGDNGHGKLGVCCITCPYFGTCCTPVCFDPANWACNNGWRPCCSCNTTVCPSFSSPVQIPGNNWICVSTGAHQTIALKSDGTMWGWGHNNHGQVGVTNLADIVCPVQLCGSGWIDIAGSSYKHFARKTDNTMWSWGHNPHAELGTSDFANKSCPVQIGSATNWIKLASSGTGNHHWGAIKSDGTLWTWGYNPHGELGNCSNGCMCCPVQVGAATSTYWRDLAVSHHNTVALACVPANYNL